jgi:anti-sigma B factor antagonist
VTASDPPGLRVTAESDGSTTVLTLAGELDLATADALRARISELLAPSSSVRRLVLDLGSLEFLDVTGLGALLEARRKLVELGGTLSLRHPRPMVRRILGLLELDEALQVEG